PPPPLHDYCTSFPLAFPDLLLYPSHKKETGLWISVIEINSDVEPVNVPLHLAIMPSITLLNLLSLILVIIPSILAAPLSGLPLDLFPKTPTPTLAATTMHSPLKGLGLTLPPVLNHMILFLLDQLCSQKHLLKSLE
ncbi:MAG TPA: hypothetical protein VL485_07085, partial [Ktedonobacteraceae bacterium]|nr:hypothetical protein [Ktedonobacteraceae bacterium]